MWTCLAWLILIIGIFSLLYFRRPPKFWIPVSAVILFVVSTGISLFFSVVFWVLWFALTALILIYPVRWKLVTKPLLHWFRKQQPPISSSERDVLEAGGVWFEKQFFSGRPDWSQLFQASSVQLTSDEQSFIDNPVETLCSLLNDWEIQQNHDFPKAAWDYIKKEGFWGLIIEKKYGGHGFSAAAHSAIVTKIASRSIAAAITIMVPNSLGPAEFISHFGTEEQKNHYLPRLVCGEEIGCFGLTAPEAGSDATNIPDVGIVCNGVHEGKEVVGIRLNFEKRYITLAPIATLIAVAFKLYDPEHLLGGKENIGITVALIPRDTPGVEAGLRHRPANLAFPNGPLRGKDVFIPLDFILGGPSCRGRGWRMMMECLSLGRGISLPALATGAAQLSFRTSGAYAQLRRQFKRSIGEFEGVGLALAKIGGFTYLCDATRLFTAQAVDVGARPSIASAITKCHVTELGRQAVMRAMDIHAGRGIQMGPRNYLGMAYQGMPIGITVEGANILTRSLIIYGQGVLRCHPYLREELMAAEHPEDTSSQAQFDKLFLSHVGFILQNACRTFFYGVTGGKTVGMRINTRAKKYLRQLTRMSYALSFISDFALAGIGAEFKFKESLSARLGDVLSHLYMASAVIHHYHSRGELLEEWPFVTWSLDYCLWQIQEAFDKFFANFPNRFLAFFMRRLVFPWGRAYVAPTDRDSFLIAESMQRGSKLRDSLTEYCYIGDKDTDAVRRVESAFQSWEKVKPLWHKLKSIKTKNSDYSPNKLLKPIEGARQTGQINEDEYEQLRDFAGRYWDALQVDEFINGERKPANEKERI